MRNNELYDSVTDGELLIVANEMANTGYTQELLIGIMHRLTNIESGREKKQRFKKNYQLITLDFISKEHAFDYEEVCEMFKIVKKLK